MNLQVLVLYYAVIPLTSNLLFCLYLLLSIFFKDGYDTIHWYMIVR
jgi:hypothetical protein